MTKIIGILTFMSMVNLIALLSLKKGFITSRPGLFDYANNKRHASDKIRIFYGDENRKICWRYHKAVTFKNEDFKMV